MRSILLILAFAAAGFFPAPPKLAAQAAGGENPNSPGRYDPIDINLIIDGSRYMQNAGGPAATWICDYLLNELLQDGDRLRIWTAEEEASVLFQGVLGADNREAVENLIRRPPAGSASADFSGALRAALAASGGGSSLMTYTLLISSSRGLSPAHLGEGVSYLRYSKVMDFSGWRAVVVALDIGPQVREAAASFLSGG
jgi:hypothetical protein